MAIWPRERRRLDKYKAKIKLKLITECNKQTTQQARPSQALKGDVAWILVYKYYHLFYVTTKRQDKGKMAFEAMCYYTESTHLIIWINWVFWKGGQLPRNLGRYDHVLVWSKKKNLMKEADKKRKTKQNKRKIFPKRNTLHDWNLHLTNDIPGLVARTVPLLFGLEWLLLAVTSLTLS